MEFHSSTICAIGQILALDPTCRHWTHFHSVYMIARC
nr:MAG TPA: hypothetical protein [Caudoviricetes sp.]